MRSASRLTFLRCEPARVPNGVTWRGWVRYHQVPVDIGITIDPDGTVHEVAFAPVGRSRTLTEVDYRHIPLDECVALVLAELNRQAI